MTFSGLALSVPYSYHLVLLSILISLFAARAALGLAGRSSAVVDLAGLGASASPQ